MSVKTIASVIALGIFVFVLYDFIVAYAKSTQTGFARWVDAAKGSATILVAQLGAAAAALVTAGDSIADWVCSILNAPGADAQFKAALGQYVTATNVGIAMLIFTALVAWARSRTLKG